MRSKNHYRILGAKGWYSNYLKTRPQAVRLLAERIQENDDNLRVKFDGKQLAGEPLADMLMDAYLHIALTQSARRSGVLPQRVAQRFGERFATMFFHA